MSECCQESAIGINSEIVGESKLPTRLSLSARTYRLKSKRLPKPAILYNKRR